MQNFKGLAHNEDSEYERDVSTHGKEVISFIQMQQVFISQLQELHHVATKLNRRFSHLDDIIKVLNEVLLNCKNLHQVVVSGKCSLAVAIKDLPSCVKKMVSLSYLIQSDLNDSQNVCVSDEDKELEKLYIDQLQLDPQIQVSRYKEVLQNLSTTVPEETIYEDVLMEIENIHYELKINSSLQKNALSVLKIQQFLIGRQPNVVSPGRVLLKEGYLYQVSYRNNKLKKMVFILFDDMLLCCRIMKKSPDWHIRDSLKCCAVLPLYLCSISFAAGTSSVKGSMFKLQCRTTSYLLLSKIPGDAQNWIRELQSAIRMHKEAKPFVRFNTRNENMENQRFQPLKRVFTSWWSDQCS